MMTPTAALRSVLDQYAGFSGRAPRSEYWWWYLWLTVVSIAFGVPALIIATMRFDGSGPIVAILGSLWAAVMVATIVPNIAVTVRRLHDANLSGWFYLINFVLVVGPIGVFVMTLLPSNPEGARFDKVAQKNAAPAWNSQRLS